MIVKTTSPVAKIGYIHQRSANNNRSRQNFMIIVKIAILIARHVRYIFTSPGGCRMSGRFYATIEPARFGLRPAGDHGRISPVGYDVLMLDKYVRHNKHWVVS